MRTVVTSRFTGFSGLYNDVRPRPPEKICKVLLKLLKTEKAASVVDLGCGTGLSTSIWPPFADKVTGIEPNDDMRKTAEENTKEASFIKASSYETDLPDRSVDIVTCSQSFHWMEPAPSIEEVSRILKSGGIFAVYDCLWPVTVSIKAETAFRKFDAAVKELCRTYKDSLPVVPQWPKLSHESNIRNSGKFSYCKKILLDNEEYCDAERFIGIAMSQGDIQTLRKHNISELEPLLAEFQKSVREDIIEATTMTVSYELIAAVNT